MLRELFTDLLAQTRSAGTLEENVAQHEQREQCQHGEHHLVGPEQVPAQPLDADGANSALDLRLQARPVLRGAVQVPLLTCAAPHRLVAVRQLVVEVCAEW